MFAENAIAIPCDDLINPISECLWQNIPDSRPLPNAIQLSQQVENCIRTRQQPLIRLAVIDRNVDRVKITSISAMPLQKVLCKLALQRCKTKTVVGVAFQKKLVEAVAEPANAVVENNWM